VGKGVGKADLTVEIPESIITSTNKNSFEDLMCSMSVHYIIQKTLITNKCTKSFFINCNTLLRVSTLLGHLQEETFCCRYTKVALYS
jgi:hypothetical protein